MPLSFSFNFPRWLWAFAALAALALLLLAVYVARVLLPGLTDPEPGFAQRKGQLLEVREIGVRSLPDGRITEVALTSSSGLKVELALRVPDELLPGRPLMILIAGQETGRESVEMIPDTRGAMVAALSYLYEGSAEFSRLKLALDLHKVQQAILDTPPAVMLALDYLLDGADIESGRVELAGVSFGAFLAAVPAALDTRIDRLWLIHGAGDPATVLTHGLDGAIPLPPLRRLAGEFLAGVAVANYLSPELWVARVSPRPIIVINAADDDDLPASTVSVLHDALREPYEILWNTGGHVHPKRPEVILNIVDLMFSRVAREGGRVEDAGGL